jgi:hypothetical protein
MTSLTPPLLAAMSGAKPRARRERIPVPKEIKLQFWVAKLLRDHCLPGWKWTHFPAGEERPSEQRWSHGKLVRYSRTATKLKQMGLQPGWPDILMFSPFVSHQIHGLECKRLGEDLTPDQEEWRDWCLAHGGKHAVAWTEDDVLRAFDNWGCLRVKYTVRPPQ